MLRKDSEIKWHEEARSSFVAIKSTLTEALVLISLNSKKYVLAFSSASDETIAVVLL